LDNNAEIDNAGSFHEWETAAGGFRLVADPPAYNMPHSTIMDPGEAVGRHQWIFPDCHPVNSATCRAAEIIESDVGFFQLTGGERDWEVEGAGQ